MAAYPPRDDDGPVQAYKAIFAVFDAPQGVMLSFVQKLTHSVLDVRGLFFFVSFLSFFFISLFCPLFFSMSLSFFPISACITAPLLSLVFFLRVWFSGRNPRVQEYVSQTLGENSSTFLETLHRLYARTRTLVQTLRKVRRSPLVVAVVQEVVQAVVAAVVWAGVQTVVQTVKQAVVRQR
jgi:hypothetical protein